MLQGWSNIHHVYAHFLHWFKSQSRSISIAQADWSIDFRSANHVAFFREKHIMNHFVVSSKARKHIDKNNMATGEESF